MPAPIVLFAYNRPGHLRATLEALSADPLASASDLHAFSDGPRTESDAVAVAEVRKILREAGGFRSVSVRQSEKNKGLGRSVIDGITEIVRAHGRVISIEDDLRVVPGFLAYLNAALDRYERDTRVFAVSGWAPDLGLDPARDDAYLCPRALCWGWATWKDRWERVDWDVRDFEAFDASRAEKFAFAAGGDDLPDMLRNWKTGRNQSWAVRWAYGQFRQGSYSLVPVRSLVESIGQDDSGTHASAKNAFRTAPLAPAGFAPLLPERPEPEPDVLRRVRRFYGYNWKGKLKRFLGWL